MTDINCKKCGQDAFKAADRGAYLRHTNPLGEIGIWQCAPSCEHKHGGQNEALLAALEDADPPSPPVGEQP